MTTAVDALLLRVFPAYERDVRAAEVLDTARASHRLDVVDALGIAWYGLRRRLALGAGQHVGDALDWATAPGVVLAGVLAALAFVLQEWAPWRSGGEQSAALLGHVGPFLTTGVVAFPVYALAALLACAGRLGATRAAVGVAYAATICAHLAGHDSLRHPAPPAVLLMTLMALCLPAVLAPRTVYPTWRTRALLGWAFLESALVLAIHHAVFGSYNERLGFVVSDLAEIGARVFDLLVPVLVVIGWLVLNRRRTAARGMSILLAPWLLLTGLRTGSEAPPEWPLLAWVALALLVLAAGLLPDRTRHEPVLVQQ